MRPHPRVRSACNAFCLLVLPATPAHASVPEDSPIAGKAPAASKAREAVHLGLAFLEGDAAKWRKERKVRRPAITGP